MSMKLDGREIIDSYENYGVEFTAIVPTAEGGTEQVRTLIECDDSEGLTAQQAARLKAFDLGGTVKRQTCYYTEWTDD